MHVVMSVLTNKLKFNYLKARSHKTQSVVAELILHVDHSVKRSNYTYV